MEEHGAVEVSWTPPLRGAVTLLICDVTPPWPPGTHVTPQDTARYGHPLSVTAAPGPDGRIRRELTRPPGRHYLLAITVDGDTAVAGDRVELSDAEAVRDLTARRLQEEIRLSWVWPEDAVAAVVSWQTDPHHGRGGQLRCTRRRYDDEGGCAARVGSGAVSVEVRAAYARPDGDLLAAPVRTFVPGIGILVRYRFRWAGLGRDRGASILELSADVTCDLPPLLVVQSTRTALPYEPNKGEVVARIPPQQIHPRAPARTVVRPRPLGRSWLVCFAAHGGGGQVTLLPPPLRRLRRSWGRWWGPW